MKNLLCILMMVALVYLVWTSKEGFTSGKTPKDTLTKIQGTNTTLSDILNVATYRESYEGMVQELDKWADHSMLNLLAQGKIGAEATNTSSDGVKLFNDLALFKKNLAEFIEVVDKMD
jgi:hypothetical protein